MNPISMNWNAADSATSPTSMSKLMANTPNVDSSDMNVIPTEGMTAANSR
ncbi:Uncharacterised protein [uncultured archaeon]|nr:Uncharacterised protein [uncultured archaeon]